MFPDVRPISGDLAPLVFDPSLGFALLEVTDVESSVEGDWESGLCRATVRATLRPDTPPPGAKVSFQFVRLADPVQRLNNGANAWNSLPLNPGGLLLVAWVPVDAPNGLYSLRGGAPQSEPASRDVAETKAAIAIQALPPASADRKARLAEALITGKDILRRYACTAITAKKFVSRAEAVELLRDAIQSPRTTPDDDIALAYYLLDPPLYDAQLGDDAPNSMVLTILARGMVDAAPAHRTMWFRYLYSRIMAEISEEKEEDTAKRRTLIRAVGTAPAAVRDRLKLIMAAGGQDGESATELLETWTKALED